MRQSGRPELWDRLCELAGLPSSASVDKVHAAFPSVGRGTIQRVKSGAATRLDSLRSMAADARITVDELMRSASHSAAEPTPDLSAWVSHDLRHQTPETVPTLSWETDLDLDSLPDAFWLVAPDDSMLPKIARGERLLFSTSIDPVAGDDVLVADMNVNLYVREYRSRAPGRWTAHATNESFLELDSERDGLRVVAVLLQHNRRRREAPASLSR